MEVSFKKLKSLFFLFLVTMSLSAEEVVIDNKAKIEESKLKKTILVLKKLGKSTSYKTLKFSKFALDKTLFVAGKGLDTFKYIVDKSDKMLSVKTFIALAIAASPVIYLYNKHVDPTFVDTKLETVQETLSSATSITTKKVGEFAAKETRAIMDETIEVIKENKGTVIKYYIYAHAIPFTTWVGTIVLKPILEGIGKTSVRLLHLNH